MGGRRGVGAVGKWVVRRGLWKAAEWDEVAGMMQRDAF